MRRLISWIGLILLATGATPSPSRKPSTPAARPDEAKPAAGSTDTARVHLAPAGAGLDAFVAWPADRSAAPAVIVIHEWWGLNAQIREVAKRLAQQGYVAIVPDLYHGKVAGDPERAHELMRGLIDEVVMSDLDATIAWLRAEPRVGLRRIGIVGFCMGGRVAELFALHSPQVAAAVMFYGPPEVDPAKLATLRAPLQGHFGGEDQGIPPSRVEELKAGLAKAGKPVDIYVYAGAGHAFMNDSRPSYHADAARQAWARTLSFFQKNLKG